MNRAGSDYIHVSRNTNVLPLVDHLTEWSVVGQLVDNGQLGQDVDVRALGQQQLAAVAQLIYQDYHYPTSLIHLHTVPVDCCMQ